MFEMIYTEEQGTQINHESKFMVMDLICLGLYDYIRL